MSKSGKKKKRFSILPILLITVLLLILSYPKIKVMLAENKKKRYFRKTFDILYKNFNIRFNEAEYKAEWIDEYMPSLLSGTYGCHRIVKKVRPEYKIEELNKEETKYSCYDDILNVHEEDVEFFDKREVVNLFELIMAYGFKPYFFNELVYDKSKGNDFEKIENIASKYNGKGPKASEELICGNFEYEGLLNVITEEDECSSSGILSGDRDRRFEKYFSVEREFEKIDWYEFKKELRVHPVIEYTFEGIEKDGLEKILEEMKPYYNNEEYSIVLVGIKKDFSEDRVSW